MRWIRSISIAIFVVSVLLFAGSLVKLFMNRDTEGPIISMEQSRLSVSVQSDREEWLTEVSAWDEVDGDVTDSLMIENVSNFIGDDERQVGVAVFDESGNITKEVITVCYTDYMAPQFSLKEPLRFPSGTSSASLTQNLQAVDCLDGEITRWIQQYNAEGSQLNTSVKGVYQVIFSVSNSAGDVEKFQASVEIYDSAEEAAAPKLLLTDYLIYLEQGTEFDPLAYVELIVVDDVAYERQDDASFANVIDLEKQGDQEAGSTEEDMTNTIRTYDISGIKVDNPVNSSIPGWYEVAYTLTDHIHNEKTVRLLVCVQEGRAS